MFPGSQHKVLRKRVPTYFFCRIRAAPGASFALSCSVGALRARRQVQARASGSSGGPSGAPLLLQGAALKTHASYSGQGGALWALNSCSFIIFMFR